MNKKIIVAFSTLAFVISILIALGLSISVDSYESFPRCNMPKEVRKSWIRGESLDDERKSDEMPTGLWDPSNPCKTMDSVNFKLYVL